eukprot:sb/3479640/
MFFSTLETSSKSYFLSSVKELAWFLMKSLSSQENGKTKFHLTFQSFSIPLVTVAVTLSSHYRGAFKWWCDTLDALLHIPNSIQNWHSLTPEQLLLLCYLWGYTLGGVITTNPISQLHPVMTTKIDDRVDDLLLAAQFFKALFQSPLPPPSYGQVYARYEIGPGFNIPCLIPGVDLLSDRWRCNPGTLMAALHYTTGTLVRHQFALQALPVLTPLPPQALPVLTLYHHVAMSLLHDQTHVVTARLLKVRALCQLSLVSEAIALWSVVSQAEAMPRLPTEHGDNQSAKTENFIPVTANSLLGVPQFNVKEPLNSTTNLAAIDHILKSKLPPIAVAPITGTLAAHANLAYCSLLVTMATLSPVVPGYGSEEQNTIQHTKFRLLNSAEVLLTQLSGLARKGESGECGTGRHVCGRGASRG